MVLIRKPHNTIVGSSFIDKDLSVVNEHYGYTYQATCSHGRCPMLPNLKRKEA